MGFYGVSPRRPLIWLHAVSVGETRAAQPLVEAIREAYPKHEILLTCMTPTGRAAGREVYGDGVTQRFLPYDIPFAVNRFFDHFSPEFGILMETEIWPNLIAAANRAAVPVVLANARLSARSARGYGRIEALAKPAFAGLSAVAAQTQADAGRLRALGCAQVLVCGNLNFDVTPAAEKLELGRRWPHPSAGGKSGLPQVLVKVKSSSYSPPGITIGLFRKIVIADPLAIYVDWVYREPNIFNSSSLILAAIFYAFQIYYDFAGYSDIAIGTGKLLGFDLLQNFNLPYFATSITELWRKWHISLSYWLRDYLYIELGGNRNGKLKNYQPFPQCNYR